MKFKVPRYIDRKPTILGPATLAQLLYLAGAVAIIFALNFMMDGPLFYILAIFLAAAGLSLAFVKIKGDDLPEYIRKFILFSFSSRQYIWTKKEGSFKQQTPTFKRKIPDKKEEEKKDDEQQLTKKSRLQSISRRIEAS